MTPFKEIVQKINTEQKYIAYCDTSIPRKLLSNEYVAHKDTIILIGPEGDFSIEEIQLALNNNYQPISPDLFVNGGIRGLIETAECIYIVGQDQIKVPYYTYKVSLKEAINKLK